MALVAALISGLFFYREAKRRGLQLSRTIVFSISQVIILFGFILSRMSTILEGFLVNGYRTPIHEFLDPSFHWYGALTGFTLIWLLALIILKGKILVNSIVFFNVLSISACLILFFGKIGCFIDGHQGCVGLPTTLPWGVHYSWGTAHSAVALHPVQIYDMLLSLGLFILLKHAIPFKYSAMFFLVTWSIFQILVEFICPAEPVFFKNSFNLAQATYLFLILTSLIAGAIQRYRLSRIDLIEIKVVS